MCKAEPSRRNLWSPTEKPTPLRLCVGNVLYFLDCNATLNATLPVLALSSSTLCSGHVSDRNATKHPRSLIRYRVSERSESTNLAHNLALVPSLEPTEADVESDPPGKLNE